MYLKVLFHQRAKNIYLVGKLFFFLLLFNLVLFPSAGKAQMKVSPTIIDAKAQRGQAQSVISITNVTDKPSRVRLYAEPFTYDRDKGFKTLPANSPNNLTPFLQFSPRELVIQPGQTRRVRITTLLAPNLPEGEYRAVVFNETLTESKDAKGKSVNLITRVGVPVYIAKGKVTSNLAVDSASFDSKKNQIQLLVRNNGKASTQTEVKWVLRRQGNVVKTGKKDSSAIIAQSDRNISLNFTDKKNEPALTPGAYQLSGELIWGENKQNRLPFNLNVTIPASSATSPKK